MKKKFTFRKLFNDIHLWLGIASGLVLFIVCLSGTVYTFHTEIDEALNAPKYTVAAAANMQPLSPDVLKAQLEKELKGKVTSIEIPAAKDKPYRFGVAKAEGGKGEGKRAEAAAGPDKESKGKEGGKPKEGKGGGRGTTYLVNPYTGQVQGTTESATSEFFSTVMKLHRFLLVETENPEEVNIGKMIVGGSTIIFIFLIISGLVIWVPAKAKNWRQGLKIKTSGNWKRTNHDLHNSLGFYSSILLLIMAITGLCWSFEWYRDGLSAVLGEEVFKGRKEKPLPSNLPANGDYATLPVTDFMQRATTILPYEGNTRISLPADSAASVVITKYKSGFFTLTASDKVQLDQYTGEPLKVDIFSEKPLNVQIAASIKPLHLGDIYGTFSKIIYFIACLIATSLPITGTIIWINKLRKKPKKRRSQKAERAVSVQGV